MLAAARWFWTAYMILGSLELLREERALDDYGQPTASLIDLLRSEMLQR